MSKSFDGAMMFTEVMFPDFDKSMLDRLQRAHEYDMEQVDKSAYHRGYVAGQRSMDAEHRAVVMRLQGLRLDEGSHENLSAIARAIMYCESYFGWTQGACKTLRDELIRLLGGIHDDPVSVVAISDACGDDCHRHDGEAWRVTYDELKSCKGGETIKLGGECDGKIMENGENHQIEATITDELVKYAVDHANDPKGYYEFTNTDVGLLVCISQHIDAEYANLMAERDKLLRKFDILKEHGIEVVDAVTGGYEIYSEEHKKVDQLKCERDELQAKLDAATHDDGAYKSKVELLLELILKNDRIEKLQAKLDAVREALDGQR